MTETVPDLGVQLCDACGQSDTDPMIHVAYGTWQKDDRTTIAEPSFHFDCIPPQFEELLENAPQHAVTIAAIEAAREGVHGEALREFIQAQPNDNEEV